MPHHRCTVGVCNNDSRYPGRYEIHSNVTSTLRFHKAPVKRMKEWVNAIRKGRKDYNPPKDLRVCSNHFIDGKPTEQNPDPMLFLTPTMNSQGTPAKKKARKEPRKRLNITSSLNFEEGGAETSSTDKTGASLDDSVIQSNFLFTPCSSLTPSSYTSNLLGVCNEGTDGERDKENISLYDTSASTKDVSVCTDDLVPVPNFPLHFIQITRESDVLTFTGIEGTEMFKAVFDYVKPKAKVMKYWYGQKRTTRLRKRKSSVELTECLLQSPDLDINESLLPMLKTGPSRKLSLEQEFLMVMMRLRLGLLIDDLAFRFNLASGTVSQIIITWIILLDKELSHLIIWPSRKRIRETLPDCFRRLYPKVRTIIDCTEIFFDTPSALDVQACMWSDYKHHVTSKFLVSITPNGAITWISPLYGGRASDIHIVRDSGFLKLLEPYDQVMADRGFKIKTDLAYMQCTLAIPPSAAKGSQMLTEDVRETSNIANVRIYVEQAIKRIKEFRILKISQPILHIPIISSVVRVCAAFTNLKRPLAE